MTSRDDIPFASPAAVNGDEARMMTTESDQFVIAIPDATKWQPNDIKWLTEENTSQCRIVKLGKCMAHVRYTGVSGERYRDLLLKMVAAGIQVVPERLLVAANLEYLQNSPDAEGIIERRAAPLKALLSPIEINVPANTVYTNDIDWPRDGKQVLARINPMHDEGQAWGLGLALGWADGRYVQINARTDGQWGIRRDGNEYLLGNYPRGKPAVIAIVLDHKRVQMNAQVKTYQYIAEFPRVEFVGAPTVVRVGKIGKTWNPRDCGDRGRVAACRVEWVKIY